MIIEKCTDKFNKLYGKKDEDTTVPYGMLERAT